MLINWTLCTRTTPSTPLHPCRHRKPFAFSVILLQFQHRPVLHSPRCGRGPVESSTFPQHRPYKYIHIWWQQSLQHKQLIFIWSHLNSFLLHFGNNANTTWQYILEIRAHPHPVVLHYLDSESAKDSVNCCGGCNAHVVILVCNLLTVSQMSSFLLVILVFCVAVTPPIHPLLYGTCSSVSEMLLVHKAGWTDRRPPCPQSYADGWESVAFKADSQ